MMNEIRDSTFENCDTFVVSDCRFDKGSVKATLKHKKEISTLCENKSSPKSQLPPKGVNLSDCGSDNKE